MALNHEAVTKAEEKMKKSIVSLENEFTTIRAGRANPQLLNKVLVNYYGTPTPLPQIGNISVPEPRLLTISLWDASIMKEVEKAILASDLGLNPSNDGKVIRLLLPGTDGRAPAGAGQTGAQDGRGCQGCRAQHSPRRNRSNP